MSRFTAKNESICNYCEYERNNGCIKTDPAKCVFNTTWNKLKHYEDLADEGRLIVLEPVKDYEKHYVVDKFGHVYSIKNGYPIEMKQTLGKHGYFCVNLKDRDRIKNARVHRLIAEAFIPNPNNKPYINHIDGDKTNNHIRNLEWCTPSENSRHALAMGMLKPPTNNVDGVHENGKNKYVVIENVTTGECVLFTNLRKACEYLGRGHDYIWYHTSKDIWTFYYGDFKIHVFLTKAEAEAKLAELKGGGSDEC